MSDVDKGRRWEDSRVWLEHLGSSWKSLSLLMDGSEVIGRLHGRLTGDYLVELNRNWREDDGAWRTSHVTVHRTNFVAERREAKEWIEARVPELRGTMGPTFEWQRKLFQEKLRVGENVVAVRKDTGKTTRTSAEV